MNNLRKYGKSPYKVVIVHGGPGASGYMESVAKELSIYEGIIEAFQTKNSIIKLIFELKQVIEIHSNLPAILVGHSWGAWLSCLFSEMYPRLIKKLILISSGPFEAKYSKETSKNRLERMSNKEKNELDMLSKQFNSESIRDKDKIFSKFGKLMSKADSFLLLPEINTDINLQYDIFKKVWPEADNLRETGRLLKTLEQIKCPVTAIHGDFDPHPYMGVKEPLTRIVKDFKFLLLEKCGHYPWKEYYAKEKFHEILKKELN